MKKRDKITLVLSLAAFGASIYSLAAAAAYKPDIANSTPISNSSCESKESDRINEVSSEFFSVKIIKIYNGSVSVFEENSDIPIDILETNPDDLPEETVNQLNTGIKVTTQDEYLSYLEDFS